MGEIELVGFLKNSGKTEAFALHLIFVKYIFVKKNFPDGFYLAKVKNDTVLINKYKSLILHEIIHLRQQSELLLIGAYLLYLLEFLIKSLLLKSFSKGYKAISMEQEAYRFQHLPYYMEIRKPFAFKKYIFSLEYDYYTD